MLIILVSLYHTLLIIHNSINIFAQSLPFNNTNSNNKSFIPEWLPEEDTIKNDDNFNTISIAQKDIKIIEPRKYYSTTVYINASNTILSQIKNVTYIFHPTFNPDKVTLNQSTNKFAYSFSASGIFTLSVDIQFINESKKTIDSTITPGIDYILPNLPPDIKILDPILEGNKITLNGKIIYSGNISRLQIDWGDGNILNGSFPFSHTYSEPRIYTITLTAFDNKSNVFTSKSVQISSLFLKNLFKNDPSIDIDIKTNTFLKLDEIPSYFTEEQISVPITGTLSYINQTGIPDVKMTIEIKNNDQNGLSKYRFTTDPTDSHGNFKAELNSFKLSNGKYNLSAHSNNVDYSKLLASRDINILPPQLSVNDLITIVGGIIAIGAGIIGGIIKIPNYIINRKQKKNLYNYLIILNDLENNYVNKEKLLTLLKERRLEILEEFKKGAITLEQYLILDDKISELVDISSNDKKP